MTTRNELYVMALLQWGEGPQIAMALEEMCELSHALLKYWRSPYKGVDPKIFDKIHEEIADVEIMMEQLRLIFASPAIDKWKQIKIDRMEERLSEKTVKRETEQ